MGGRGNAMTEDVHVTRRERFRALHRQGLFVMPNAWDIGSARLLASLGFEAIATTSSGHAASLGRADQDVKRNELLSHVEALVAAVDLPVKKGQRLGEVRILDGARLVASSPLVAARAIEKPGFFSRASWYAGQALGSIWP